MKRIFLFVTALIMVFAINASADMVTLDSDEILSAPISNRLEWYIDLIDARTQSMIVQYQWRDGAGDPIHINGAYWHMWRCDDQCFRDVFGFLIRPEDVDCKVGIALRKLIWFHFKQDVLTPGNDGTFEQQ